MQMIRLQSTKQKSKFPLKSRKDKNKALVAGTLVACFLIATPFIVALYKIFPDARIWESSFGTYESNYYESVQVAFWTLTGKIVPMTMLVLWFFTCKHWWYHAILVPICLYAYQIVGILNDDLQFVELTDIYVLAPIVMIVSIFSYTIRTKVFDKIHGIDLSELRRVDWKGDFSEGEDTSRDTNSEKTEDSEPIFMSNLN